MDNGPTGSPTSAKAGKVAVGHPVDVASGTLFHNFDDYTLPGRLPIAFKRRYSTGLLDQSASGIFGRGWSSPFDVTLSQRDGQIIYVDESGESEFVFVVPEAWRSTDQPILNAGSFADLTATDKEYCVSRWNPDNGSITRDYFPKKFGSQPTAIARREDDESNAIEFVYAEPNGLLNYIVQKREQRGLQLIYDDYSRLVEVRRRSKQTDEQSKSESKTAWLKYQYNPAGMLETFTDPLGNQSHYKYDAAGQMVSEVTVAGKEWRFVFDVQGRCVVTTGKNKFDYHKLDYGNEKARVTKVEDSYGNITQYHYNESGQVLKQISPLGHASTTIFDAAGRIVQLITPEGRTTTYEYDDAGNRASVTTADGATVSYSFNARHQAISMIDPAGHRWQKAYDSLGRAVSQTNPAGATQSYQYNSTGDLTEHKDAADNVRQFNWDAQGNLVGASDWEGNFSNYQWDKFGALTENEDPLGHITEFKRDLMGQLLEVNLPDDHKRSYQWDVFGNLTSYTDERNQTTQWQYCDCGNLESEQRADGSTVTYGWNAIPGQLAALTNQKNEVYHFQYDEDGRLVEESNFAGSTTRYLHDSDGQVVVTTKPSGKEIRHEYDALGKVVRTTYANGDQTSFAYDPRGLLIKADNGRCPVTFEYDDLGRVVHENQGGHELWHDYDDLDNRIERRTNDDDVTRFNWTPNRQIRMVEPFDNVAVAFDYDGRGFETRRTLGSLTFSSELDGRGRLVNQVLDFKGKNIVQRDYQYDAASNLLVKKDSQWGTTKYVYDQLEHITETLHPENITETFQYDKAENVSGYALRTPDKGEGDLDDSWIYGKGSRVKQAGGKTYVYDKDGQLIERNSPIGRSTYAWNDAGQLVSLVNEAGEDWRYTYDALGRRVEKQGPAVRHEYQWDGDVVLRDCKIVEGGESTVDSWEYHPHDFSPLYKLTVDSQYLCVNDQIGTPMELVNGDGKIDWSRQSLTFGAEWKQGSDTVDCNIRFQGQWYDAESELCYNRFRYYSTELTAYISDDPIGLIGGINVRSYVTSPVTWVDPYGLAKKCTEEITRRMSAEEAAATLEAGGLVPKPGHERTPKWVTIGGAGKAQKIAKKNHEVTVVFGVKKGTTKALQDNSVDFSQLAGETSAPNKVITKSNEPGALGIGSGVVPFFNESVVDVKIVK